MRRKRQSYGRRFEEFRFPILKENKRGKERKVYLDLVGDVQKSHESVRETPKERGF